MQPCEERSTKTLTNSVCMCTGSPAQQVISIVLDGIEVSQSQVGMRDFRPSLHVGCTSLS